MEKQKFITAALGLVFLTAFSVIQAQMITGVWKGKINKQKAEVKIIQNGDNLTGTAYYYESAGNYRRYSIKGYFDPNTNEAVWWDDQLLEEKTGRLISPGKVPLLARADFNCPGDGRMMLDGKASKVDNQNEKAGDVDLDKTGNPNFPDEWDFVIENYTVGANDPDIIDSIGSLSSLRTTDEEVLVVNNNNPVGSKSPVSAIPKKDFPKAEPKLPGVTIAPVKPLTIEEKFASRKKLFATEIPVTGDSIELRFYDNAQIDGDSISLFLNDKLIFEHIRLTEKAYIIKLPVAELNTSNELIMVAENLGSIPPNTSYMIAEMGEKRYEARLESTEGSSALIRLVKKGL
ncbi:MAG: hypothetical protein ACXWWD_11135 [Chitinophagaceae bacterium]